MLKRLWNPEYIGIYVTIAVLLFISFRAIFHHSSPHTQTPGNSPSETQQTVTEPDAIKVLATADIYNEINVRRQAIGVQALTLTAELVKSAEDKCNDMVANSYFAPVSPITNKSGTALARENMHNVLATAENMHESTETGSKDFVDNWFTDRKQKLVMLDAKYTNVGYAICVVPNVPGTVVVQHLAELYTQPSALTPLL